MLEVLNTKRDNILEIRTENKVSEQDLEQFVPVLKDHIADHEHPCLLVTLEGFEGWSEITAFWKDLKLDSKYADQFNKIAIAGDKTWLKWLTKTFSSAVSSEIKYFDKTELQHARNWLKA